MSASQDNARFGLIIVGDEILSGRRQDKHMSKVIELLSARGLQLSWVEVLSDDRALLTAAFERSFASGDIVFSCGGIGATPDDHTRQAAAAALKLPLTLHPFAAEQIGLRVAETAAKGGGNPDINAPENQQRLQMGYFPQGCEAVVNPFNRIPGFFIQHHTFVPGFPVIAMHTCITKISRSNIHSWSMACPNRGSRLHSKHSSKSGQVCAPLVCPQWVRVAGCPILSWA